MENHSDLECVRLRNILNATGLTIEDFAVLDPSLAKNFRGMGRKTMRELMRALEEKGIKPGKYNGAPFLSTGEAVEYYLDHMKEFREENPALYTGTRNLDEDAFRRDVAKELLVSFANHLDYDKCDPGDYDPDYYANVAVEWADSLIKRLK